MDADDIILRGGFRKVQVNLASAGAACSGKSQEILKWLDISLGLSSDRRPLACWDSLIHFFFRTSGLTLSRGPKCHVEHRSHPINNRFLHDLDRALPFPMPCWNDFGPYMQNTRALKLRSIGLGLWVFVF